MKAHSQLLNLASLSNTDLKIRVGTLTSAMREFEGRRREARDRVMHPRSDAMPSWDDMMAQATEDSRVERDYFAKNFRPLAAALLEEVDRRAGSSLEDTDHQAGAITHGMLSGIDPIGEAALYIEKSARRLTDD